MPTPNDPNRNKKGKYNPARSHYSPESPPEGTPAVYLPMAERIANNFELEYGALGEPPVRYCVIEDLDESLGSLRDVVLSLLALRAKHQFCRQLMTGYGISGEGLWHLVRAVQSGKDAGGFNPSVTVLVTLEGGATLYNFSAYGADLPAEAQLGIDGKDLGRAADWEEIEAKAAAYRSGEWDGTGETWDHVERAPFSTGDRAETSEVTPDVAEAVARVFASARKAPPRKRERRPISPLTFALRKAIRERGFTNKSAAEAIGISRNALQERFAWKGGLDADRGSDLDLVIRIADAIGTPPGRILQEALHLAKQTSGGLTNGEGSV